MGERSIMGAKTVINLLSLLLLPLALLNSAVRADLTGAPPAEVPLFEGQIEIDGVLEGAWDGALIITLPYEVTPGENTPAPVDTECMIMSSRTHLYIAFRCHDPRPEEISANFADRDDAWDDDRVVVLFDTFNDQRRAYNFCLNPLGVQMDYAGPAGSEDVGWDAIWDSAGRSDSEGWIVEAAIPFSSLSFQRVQGKQTWGMIAARSYPRSRGVWTCSVPEDRGSNCRLCAAQKIVGFEGIVPGKNVEISPTVTAIASYERADFPRGEMEESGSDAEAGLTAKWGLTPNLNLMATINPDFSQVEADAMLLDVNQPFALSYEERRPFFTEGGDYFNTRLNAVYTRVLRQPTMGIKLSGKEGDNAIGAFFVRDDLTNILFPGNQRSSATSLDSENSSTVVRYRRDLSNRYNIGVLLTDREGDDYFNRVIGIDSELRFTDTERLWVQVLGSSTSYPNEVATRNDQQVGDFFDSAAYLSYRHDTRDWDAWLTYEQLGRGFRADLGFMPMVDYRGLQIGTSRAWYGEPGEWFSQIEVAGVYIKREDLEGNPLYSNAHAALVYQGPLRFYAYVQPEWIRESYAGREFDIKEIYSDFGIRPHKKLYAALDITAGDAIDYTHVRKGERLRLSPRLVLWPGNRLFFVFDHDYEKLNVPGGRLYTANISFLYTVYHLSSRMFVRSIIQYRDYSYNPELYTAPMESSQRRLQTQLLFSYKVNPRTVIYLGYSDSHFGGEDYGLTQQTRTLFLKLGYAWQL